MSHELCCLSACWLLLCRLTTLILITLLLSAFYFGRDATTFVILPIETMLSYLRRIMNYGQEGKLEVELCCQHYHRGSIEMGSELFIQICHISPPSLGPTPFRHLNRDATVHVA